MPTYFRPNNGSFYTADKPESPEHKMFPPKPDGFSEHAVFNTQSWEWVELPLVSLKKRKQHDVFRHYEECFLQLNEVYPIHEREGWAVQEKEAQDFLADNNAVTPTLDILIESRGNSETKVELANKIIKNSNKWKKAYAWYTGQQQKMYKEIEAVEDRAELDSISVHFNRLHDEEE